MTQRTIYRLRPWRVGLLVTLVAILLAFWTARLAGADSPEALDAADSSPSILNYQGIVRVDGKPYSGPTGHFKFAIVDAATGNGTTNYWANDGKASGQPSASVALAVSGGLFNVLLGDTSLSGMSEDIDATVFSAEPTYLRVWFSPSGNPGSFSALNPNQRFASVAHALRSERAHRVDGFHASASPAPNRLIALDSSGYLRVPRVIDSGNTNYYLDPSGTSILTSLDLRKNLYNGNAPHVEVNDGLHVLDPDVTGLWVSGSGDHGVWVSGAGDDGVNVSSAVGDGLHVGTAGDYGIHIYEAAKSGVHVDSSEEFGFSAGEPEWSAFHVEDTDASGFYVKNAGWGVYVESSDHYGVNARGRTAGGFFKDADTGKYAYAGYGSYGIYSNGTIRGTSFTTTQLHPKDPERMIVYGALEGGEAGTYHRGSARLHQGTAVVLLPEHFGLVTEEESLTVQVTPRGDCNGLYVAEATTRQIVVKELQGGTSDAPFDFLINGVRAGSAGRQVIQSNAGLLPEDAADPERGLPDG